MLDGGAVPRRPRRLGARVGDENEGSKLRDGANINRSLLALANCINALGKKQQGAGVYVRSGTLSSPGC